MTTNTLLTLIAVLLLARVVLQVWLGKETLERANATASEIDGMAVFVSKDEYWKINSEIRTYCQMGYELVNAQSNVVITVNNELATGTMLYFTRKKIKNYMEE